MLYPAHGEVVQTRMMVNGRIIYTMAMMALEHLSCQEVNLILQRLATFFRQATILN